VGCAALCIVSAEVTDTGQAGAQQDLAQANYRIEFHHMKYSVLNILP
jgi:hypothetical protein